MLVCRTRDISIVGIALDTETTIDAGTRVTISILDPQRGLVIELEGEVARPLAGHPGVGVTLFEPPDEWHLLIAERAAATSPAEHRPAPRRLRVLVVGDDQRRRGALALYVTSGWDVRFASDLDGTVEALGDFQIDAVIAEHDAQDDRWEPILDQARRTQPRARRIVRGAVHGAPPAVPLVHRFVDREAGLDALLDALTADFGAPA